MCVAGVTRPSRRHPPRHAVTSDTQLWSVLGPRRMGPGPGRGWAGRGSVNTNTGRDNRRQQQQCHWSSEAIIRRLSEKMQMMCPAQCPQSAQNTQVLLLIIHTCRQWDFAKVRDALVRPTRHCEINFAKSR